MTSNYLSSIIIASPIKIRILIDTGAENINIISKKMFEKFKETNKDIFYEKDEINIKPLGSKLMKTSGTTKLSLDLTEGLTTELIPFAITDELSQYDIILGLPAIQQLRINLDINNGIVKILDKNFKLSINNYIKKSEIRTKKQETISSGKELKWTTQSSKIHQRFII